MMKSLRYFLLAIVLVGAWFLRPFFHGILMNFYISPLKGLVILLFIILIWRVLKKIWPLKFVKIGTASYTLKGGEGSGVAIGLLAMAIALMGLVLSFESELRLVKTIHNIDFAERQNVPEFTNIRLIPKPVAGRFARDSFQSPQEFLGDSQIVLVDGQLKRVFPRLPDGWLLKLTHKLNGFVTVDVDTLDRKVAISDQKFEIADQIGIFDNLYYRLHLKKYFVSYTKEPIYLKNDAGKWVTVVPYIDYQGFPVRMPVWGGVMVVDSNGTISDYSPEQAQEISYLKGNRIHPKELATYYTHSYSYKNGLINKWFLHREQIEVVRLPGDEEVIHVPTADGFKQFVAAEPYGKSYGIYKIFVIDATSGKREIISYDQNSQLTGPVAAADYIKKEFPTFDWSSFILSEPRPVKINNDLYWLMSIIPNDAAGITTSVFLNTHTNQVLKASNEAEIRAAISQGVSAVAPSGQTPTDLNGQIKQKIDEIQKQLDEIRKLI